MRHTENLVDMYDRQATTTWGQQITAHGSSWMVYLHWGVLSTGRA
jgi:hypothetical protein